MHPNLQNAIRRASAHPLRTGFQWQAGVHMADLAFAFVRMLLLAAVLSGLAYGAWALMKREPSTKPIASKQAIEKTKQQADRKNQ